MDDAPALAAILRAWIYEMEWMPKLHEPAQDLGFLQHVLANQCVTVARLNRATAGFLARSGSEVSCLYLAPTARGQGIGTQLLTRAKAEVAKLELWTFQTNTGARRFYASNGFDEVELTDGSGNDEKLPDVRLVWGAMNDPV